MAQYKVTAPDGNTYTITAPDDATPDQVQAYAQANYQHPQVDAGVAHAADPQTGLPSNQLPTQTATPSADDYRDAGMSVPAALRSDDESGFQKLNDIGNDAGDAFLKHLTNPIVGGAQLIDHGINAAANLLPQGNSVRQFINADTAKGDQQIADSEAMYQRNTPTNAASIIGGGAGEVLPFALDAPAKALQYIGEGATKLLPKAAGAVTRKVASGAAQGATVGALQPVTSGPESQPTVAQLVSGTDQPSAPSFLDQKLKQAGLGAAVGGAVPAIASIPRALVGSIDPETQALAQKAAQHGIDITAPQVSTSFPLKVANSVTSQVPFSGAAKFAEKQQGQFNNAVAQTIGLPQGTTKITPDVFSQAKNAASNGFNTLWQNNNLPVTPQLLQKAVSIGNDAAQLGGADTGNAINTMIDRIVDQGSSGVLPGRAFQSIDSQLGKLASAGGEKAHYANRLQDVLRDEMQNAMPPQDAAQLQQLRGIWRNIKQLTPIVSKTTTGDVPPAQLMGAVTNNGSSKAAMATGVRGDLGDLAQIGQRFLKPQVQDSGTAARLGAQSALKTVATGAGALTSIPATAGVIGGSRLLQSGLRSRTLYNALANLPQQAVSTSPRLNQLSYLLEQQAASQNALSQQPQMMLPAPQIPVGVQR